MNIPVEQMYKQRKDFIIVALTGITGSGCSDLAKLMAQPFSQWKNQLRQPQDINEMRDGSKQEMVFQREYDLCFHVCEKQYQPFEIIKYRNVLLLITLESFASKSKDFLSMLGLMQELIKQKFDKSHELEADVIDKDYIINNEFNQDVLVKLGLTEELYRKFFDISHIDKLKDKREYRMKLYDVFNCKIFNNFCESFYDELKRRDYYAKNFFVSRLATSLRSSDDPLKVIKSNVYKDNDFIFTIVDRINNIVKGYHESYPEKPRRFVIDSVRNSMEILYLRERYNAFYMVALHNDGNEKHMILNKVSHAMYNADFSKLNQDQAGNVSFLASKMMTLSRLESDLDDFEKGKFYGPDISRCVTESEIHIAFHRFEDFEEAKKKSTAKFYSTAEQWMKFYSLIIRPGLITPSRDERCMSVAYVAKFNSGCISRQVGCTIVDQHANILSVGWNDPPSSQLPCQLRYADELCHCDDKEYEYISKSDTKIFSKFEKYGEVKPDDKNKASNTFRNFMKEDVKDATVSKLRKLGLRYPYCFRSRYNKFRGVRDQVNTRSLHAEENTMLRIAKSGGQSLNGGIMYVTASPCVLCSKKAFQIGIKEIVYLDPYTDIAPDLILQCGFDQPILRPFMGAIGETFYKLYKPFMPYKDELTIWENN